LYITFFKDYCITITSNANDSCIGFEAESLASEWKGTMVHVFHDDKKLGDLPFGFTNKKFCVPMNKIDVSNDSFIIKLANTDELSNVSRGQVIINYLLINMKILK